MLKKVIAFTLVLGLIGSILVGCGQKGADSAGNTQDAITLKFALGTAQSAKDMAVKFKEIVEKNSNGAIKINIHPDNSLGGDRELIEGAQFGNIDIVMVSSTPLSSFYKNLYIYDIPFLFTNREQAYKVLDGEIGKKIGDGLESKGLKFLAYNENGFRNLTTSNRAIKTPDDAKGLKLRVMENEVHIAAWKALNANPTPMAFTELFTALQQRTVDGQDNPSELIYANKFHEVQKYLIRTEHVYTPYVIVMNKDKFNGLTDEQEKIIMDAMKEATVYQRGQAKKYDQESIEKIKAAKTTEVIELTESEKKAFQEKMEPVFDLVKSKIDNPEYLDEVIAAIKK
ncbi:MAG: TRAP-type transport system periplasmic protein [Petroclostridium sp.]|jgi:tripartite ATP-independent transporter DctP family solute receptor|uniref:TRAP transporter substrate-binding protein n=1 Tax=Petroclostridium xylanilyticum TaxID=1792311 RepID=UPI000B99447F|nr:DctP family TRAP transporter solute-binding subunit [Petroclostridium xylanilyticum]MBZ4645392.1 dicarboxylate transporter, DctP subunit [Clostridia bacterium]MDK2810773.1 TRAP-type transport system periplasmic protein [Petroclostridium sp.]